MISYLGVVIKKIISMLHTIGNHNNNNKTLSMIEQIENNYGTDSSAVLDAIHKLSKQAMRRKLHNIHLTDKVETSLYGTVFIEMLSYDIKKDAGLMQGVTHFTISDGKNRFFEYK